MAAGSVLLEKLQLVQTLQQAGQLLNSQCDLVDDLKAQLAEALAKPLSAQEQQLYNMPESSLAAMQQKRTADMMKAVAEYVRHEAPGLAGQDARPEDSLAAMQQQHIVKLIREVTLYLQRDMQYMQQMARLIKAGTPA